MKKKPSNLAHILQNSLKPLLKLHLKNISTQVCNLNRRTETIQDFVAEISQIN